MKKKDIYEKHGITYKNGKILTPLGWMTEPLKKGNSKTGAGVFTWSMTTKTCGQRCDGCYGEKGFYNMPNVKKSLQNNTRLAMEYLAFWKAAVLAQCETLKDGTEIRIHAVGDFFSAEYVQAWHDIAEAFPELIFWTYTKRTQYETAFDDLDNANIVKSLINGKYNFGPCEHVTKLYEELKAENRSVHICKCGVDDEQHCEGCHKCSISEFVLFLEHSTDYNAKKDPGYEAFCELVNSQED